MLLNSILPPEATSNASRVILTGARTLLIEGHKGLLSYDSDCIKVQLSEALLICRGSSLVISQFAANDLWIEGRINLLELKL